MTLSTINNNDDDGYDDNGDSGHSILYSHQQCTKVPVNKLVKLIYDIRIPILSLYPEELNAGSYLHTCVCSHIIHNNQTVEGTQVPNNRCIKMWYIHTMEDKPALKNMEILTHAKTWMNIC